MMQIKNYTFEDFIKMDQDTVDEYMVILRNIKNVDTDTKVNQLTLKEVDDLKKGQLNPTNNNLIAMVAMVQSIEEDVAMKLPIVSFIPIYLSIVEQLEHLVNGEQQLVPAHTNLKWEMVEGSVKMGKFGLFNTTISLAEQFNTTPQEIEKWKYSYVFTILLHNTVKGNLQYEMSKIKTKVE